LLVYAMEIAQPAAQEAVARAQSPKQLGPTADPQFHEQHDLAASVNVFPITTPTLGCVTFYLCIGESSTPDFDACSPNQVSVWISYGKTALIAVVSLLHSERGYFL